MKHRLAASTCMSKIRQLWRGELGLAKTGWLYGLLGILCLTVPLTLITSLGYQHEVPLLVLLLSVYILIYAVFMAVAVWRAASKHTGHRFPAWLAKGSILFIVLYVAVGLLS